MTRDRCPTSADQPPELTSYLEANVPGRYWIDLAVRDGDWQPASALPMPRHHASRLELDNLAQFPELSRGDLRRVRATVELVARDVRQVPGQHQWRATYHAKLLAVCPLP